MTGFDLILDRLDENTKKYSSKTAVTFLASGPDGGKVEQQLTYGALIKESFKVAHKLMANGISKGDRVVLVYPPSLDYMVAFIACLRIGVIAVPVFPPNPARRDTLVMFTRIVGSSRAKFALTSSTYNHMKKLAGIRNAVTTFKRPTGAWPENLTWLITDTGETTPQSTINLTLQPTDVAFLQFTSGSTSDPKGVMITHANLAHNLTIITNELKAVDDTVVVSWLPQYHDMGLIGSYLGLLYCGGTGYYMSPLSFLQRPMMWIEAVSKYKATHLQAPNFAFKLTARKSGGSSIDKLTLDSVRHVINAAEPVTEDSLSAFHQAFDKYGFQDVIFPTYGLAEHTVFVCSGGKQRLSVDKVRLETDGKVVIIDAPGESDTISRLVGCGYPASQGVDVRIVDRDALVELDEGCVGEIWIRSDSKAAGYYGKPEESKADFEASLAGQSDGFLRTGDLGFFHNQELFICGRLKDLIIIGGRNYYPQDIEATAESSSASLRPGCSAAFTIDPTQKEGEEVAMVLELREVPSNAKQVCEPIVDEIRAVVTQEHSLSISQIVLLKPKSVPKTTSGKIARAWCRKGFLANSLDAVYRKSFKTNKSSLEIEQEGRVKAVTKEDIAKLRAMSKEAIVEKLGLEMAQIGNVLPTAIANDAAIATMLDSLSVSQFKGQLESRYEVKISDEYLFRETTTLNKLAEVVKLGFAPDDGDGSPPVSQPQGQNGGLAGALGCPPGVVCTIL